MTAYFPFFTHIYLQFSCKNFKATIFIICYIHLIFCLFFMQTLEKIKLVDRFFKKSFSFKFQVDSRFQVFQIFCKAMILMKCWEVSCWMNKAKLTMCTKMKINSNWKSKEWCHHHLSVENFLRDYDIIKWLSSILLKVSFFNMNPIKIPSKLPINWPRSIAQDTYLIKCMK